MTSGTVDEFQLGKAMGRKESEDRISELHHALAFAASVIKSGESWSATCEEIIGGALGKTSKTDTKIMSESERWMRKWAMEHLLDDDYYDNVNKDAAYAFALKIGEEHSVGPYESARDYIDDGWWDHWEAITGKKGVRGVYFSCAC